MAVDNVAEPSLERCTQSSVTVYTPPRQRFGLGDLPGCASGRGRGLGFT
jgi:hypothetical protein